MWCDILLGLVFHIETVTAEWLHLFIYLVSYCIDWCVIKRPGLLQFSTITKFHSTCMKLEMISILDFAAFTTETFHFAVIIFNLKNDDFFVVNYVFTCSCSLFFFCYYSPILVYSHTLLSTVIYITLLHQDLLIESPVSFWQMTNNNNKQREYLALYVIIFCFVYTIKKAVCAAVCVGCYSALLSFSKFDVQLSCALFFVQSGCDPATFMCRCCVHRKRWRWM